jgi:DNA polymerase (family 10)
LKSKTTFTGSSQSPERSTPLRLPTSRAKLFPTMMLRKTKDEVVELLESIARLLELKGENVFKIRAYTNAARSLETFSGEFAPLVLENRLGEIGGIGEALAEKITTFATSGALPYYESLRAEFPPTLFDLFELQGLGPKKIKVLWDELQITTLEGLEKACREGSVAALKGFGEKTAANFLAALESRKQYAGRFRLGDIAAQAQVLLEQIKELPEVSQAALAGSYRRRKETVHDLDFIVATRSPEVVSQFFVSHPMVESVLAHGATKSSVRLRGGIQADLRVVSQEHYPFALVYFTGSKEHNIALRNRAISMGWSLNEYRLAPDERARVTAPELPPIHTEADVYRALRLDYIEPELREDRGEVAAAAEHRLPDLIEIENLRGTFHNHTVASDGASTLEEMAAAAQELGLEYLGISDHSVSSFQANGLDSVRLLEQVAQIRHLNASFDGDFRIFSGVECDILKDGSLDYPDSILSELDYVVASVHSSFTLSQSEMTKRIIRAISNPYVTMLGHLTGRLLLSREGYAVDIPAILDAAAETGTIIELNCNPRRLDMDWRWWPLAKQKGVRCSINPDAHHTAHLQFLWNGIGTARKGWLTKKDVINTLPLSRIPEVLSAKRRQHAPTPA